MVSISSQQPQGNIKFKGERQTKFLVAALHICERIMGQN